MHLPHEGARRRIRDKPGEFCSMVFIISLEHLFERNGDLLANWSAVKRDLISRDVSMFKILIQFFFC